jgi:hypothetical protein
MPRRKHRLSWMYEDTPKEEDSLAASPVEVAYPSPAYGVSPDEALFEKSPAAPKEGMLTDRTSQQKSTLLPKKHHRLRSLTPPKKHHRRLRSLMMPPKKHHRRLRSLMMPPKKHHRLKSLLLPKKCQLNRRQWSRPMSRLDLEPKTLMEKVQIL